MDYERWHLVQGEHLIRVAADFNGEPGGAPIAIGSTSLSFRPHRTGRKRGEKAVCGCFRPEDIAKARLIAAAPELLRACRRAYISDRVVYGVQSEMCVQLENSIALAIGGPLTPLE